MTDLPPCSGLNNDFAAPYTAVCGKQAASTMAAAVGAVVAVIQHAVGVATWAVAKDVISHRNQSSIPCASQHWKCSHVTLTTRSQATELGAVTQRLRRLSKLAQKAMWLSALAHRQSHGA